MHASGGWEEAGIPGANMRKHGESIQTPHNKAQADFQSGNLFALQ